MTELETFDVAFTPAVATAPPAPPVQTPTPQQAALYAAVADGTEHIAVEAVAGSGKTTSAVGAAQAARGRVGFVAFNKHIAAELQGRLGGRAKACTLHSLGFAAVRRAFPGVALDEQKPHRILERLRPRWMTTTARGRVVWYEDGTATLALARLAKLTLADGGNESLTAIADYYGIDGANDEVFGAVRELLARSAEQTAIIDYDDMVWLPVRLKLPVEQFDVLLVDEAQDLSAVQHGLVCRAATGGRVIPIGDRRQAIYGFAGSDPQSLPRLVEQLGAPTGRGVRQCPLTVTFRCPRSHVALAQKIVPQIEAAPGAIDGWIDSIEPYELAGKVKPGDLVVSRINAPLVGLAFKLIRMGTPAMMLGRDIGKGLTRLIDELQATSTIDLIGRTRDWQEREILRLERRDAPESSIQGVVDRAECLIELASATDSVPWLRNQIESLFADAADSAKVVTLASVHRAKGSEADRVFIAAPDRMPLRFESRRRTGPPKVRTWEHEQELNLIYVAVTRAKKELYFAGDVPAVLS